MSKDRSVLTLATGGLLGGALAFSVSYFVFFQPRILALEEANRDLQASYRNARVQTAQAMSDAERLNTNLNSLQERLMRRAEVQVQEASLTTATSSPAPGQNPFRAQADKLWKAGKKDEAVALLMDVYRSSTSRLDRSAAVAELLRLSRTDYPPARSALIALRNEQEVAALADSNNRQLLMEVLHLNNVLQDGPRILALHDQIPKDDWRSMWVSMVAFDHLVGARRYDEAVEARPVHRMQALVDHWLNQQNQGVDPIAQQALFDTIGNNIEALVGAGRETDAQNLVAQLTKGFSDDTALANVRTRLNRMGRADLVDAMQRKR